MSEVKAILTAQWRYVAMLNYEVDQKALRQLAPAGTELDSFSGKYFLSLVGFRVQGAKLSGYSFPFHSDFEEVTLRFYVRRKVFQEWRRGVASVKRIVPRYAIAKVARGTYGENCVSLPMRQLVTPSHVRYEWRFEGRWNSLAVSPAAGAEVQPIAQGSEEEFLAEHNWGYSKAPGNAASEYRVEHPRWSFWPVLHPVLDCDSEALFGTTLGEPLQGDPSSAFLVEGSEVSVWPGDKIPPAV